MAEQQTQWAEPLPAVLFSSAVAFFGLAALLTGSVSLASAPLLIVWVAGISLVCIIGAIIAFRRGDIFGGTLSAIIGGVLFGSGTWLSFLGKFVGWPWGAPVFGAGAAVAIPPQIEGWMWIGLVMFLVVGGIAGLKVSWFLGFALWWIAVAAALAPCAWSFMGCPGMPADPSMGISSTLPMVSGWMMLLFALMIFYFATAVWLGTFFGKPVLPIGKPLIK